MAPQPQTGEPYETEYRLRHHSGEYRWTLGRALPVRNERGDIERWFGTCTDIDTIKRLTAEREQLLESERAARTEAERASRLKDDFLATLSHEIRTPLSAILGWTQVLSHGQRQGDELKRGLEAIERNARAQAQLINDLLDMSRVVSGKLRLDVQALQPASFIEAAIETVMPAAVAKGIRIETVFDARAEPVAGDSDRLQQVVWNLLSNAIKFTPKGGKVQIRVTTVDSQLQIDVADTGQGIAAPFLPHVFDRFRQADASTTRTHGGLGLGLAIVKQLVELHGGTVSAASAGEDRGTTFTVALPLWLAQGQTDDERTEPRASTAVASRVLSASLAGLTLLVVDDEQDLREILKRMLEECGAQVITAASALDGLAAIGSARPDVLVSDIGMPGIDGYEFLRRVRALDAGDGRQIGAVALTAFARPEDRTKALVAGFLAHVAKPADPAELVATIAAVARQTGRKMAQ